VNREQRLWATIAGVMFLLAVLGGLWALQRQTNDIKDDQHRSDCLQLAGQQKAVAILLDGERAVVVDNRTIHREGIAGALSAPLSEAVLKAIPPLQDICGASADEILAREIQRANEGG
jgi:hypothetical protein